MGVGDSFEVPYTLSGPVPAGTYQVGLSGFQSTNDGQLHFVLVYRPSGAAERTLATGEARWAGTPATVDLTAPALAATCADALALDVTLASGGSGFTELRLTLDVP